MRNAVFLLVLLPEVAAARGFSTVLPMTVPPADRKAAAPSGVYIDAPLPSATPFAAAAPKLTTAGHVLELARHFFDGGGPVTHDPTTGTPIGQFGEAYTYASPVGRGLSSQMQTSGVP